MAGFILEYGTKDGSHHVSIDMGRDAVTVYLPMPDPEESGKWSGTCDEFETLYPELVAEMIADGVLRSK